MLHQNLKIFTCDWVNELQITAIKSHSVYFVGLEEEEYFLPPPLSLLLLKKCCVFYRIQQFKADYGKYSLQLVLLGKSDMQKEYAYT